MRTLQIGMGARGGLDRYYAGLLQALPARGVAVRGLVAGDPGDDRAIVSFAPNGAGMLRRWSGLRRALQRELPRTDLLVSHFAPYAFGILDRLRARPLVVHFHGPWAQESALEGQRALRVAAKRAIERAVYRHGARVVALSEAFAAIAERDYAVPREAIRVIPGGVDVARFATALTRDAARDRLRIARDRRVVVCVRRLVRAKGVEHLIDAIDLARRTIPDVLLIVAGTGPLAGELRRRVDERGLARWVELRGFVADDDLPALYRAADLTVVPTRALEGFGLIVLESLACGTPALVTPVAGLPEVVAGLDRALVLPSRETSAIAAGIADILSGAQRVPDEDACRRYAARFDWNVIAEQVRDVYREVA